VSSSFGAQDILAMQFTVRIISARVADAVMIFSGSAQGCESRGFRCRDANNAPTKNVKQGYRLSQLTFPEMTRKTQDGA